MMQKIAPFLEGISVPFFIKCNVSGYIYWNKAFSNHYNFPIYKPLEMLEAGAVDILHDKFYILSCTEINNSKIERGCIGIAKEVVALPQKPSKIDVQALTSREVLVLNLLGEGCSVKEIASQLTISKHTVADYTKSIYSKLGAHSKTEALYNAQFYKSIGLP